MHPRHLDFRHLKTVVSIEHVLASHGISGMRRQGRRLVGPCPIHRGDNPRAFVADLERNLWYCFSGCGSGGDVVDLVRQLDGVGYREAACILANLAGQPGPPPQAPPPRAVQAFQPYVRRLQLDPHARLLQAKRIRAQTARRFETGLWHGRGFLSRCIGVRLHDPAGRPLGYAGRRLDPIQARRRGKWKLPPRLPKSRILYNSHRLDGIADCCLVVVECPWGVMRLAQLHIPAVALLGCSLSRPQRRLMISARRVLLLLDGDDAGRAASARISTLISSQTDTRILRLPDDTDPDDLTDDELASTLHPYLSL